jgi:hypothetical protein
MKTIRGWVLDRNNVASKPTVSVRLNGEEVARVVANQFRQDVLDAGHGDGYSGWSVNVSPTPGHYDVSAVVVGSPTSFSLTASSGGSFDVAADGTVTADLDLRWNTIQVVTHDADLRWDVRASALNDAQLLWNIQQSVTNDAELDWDVQRTAVTADADLRWNVLAAAVRDATLQWDVLTTRGVAPPVFPEVGESNINERIAAPGVFMSITTPEEWNVGGRCGNNSDGVNATPTGALIGVDPTADWPAPNNVPHTREDGGLQFDFPSEAGAGFQGNHYLNFIDRNTGLQRKFNMPEDGEVFWQFEYFKSGGMQLTETMYPNNGVDGSDGESIADQKLCDLGDAFALDPDVNVSWRSTTSADGKLVFVFKEMTGAIHSYFRNHATGGDIALEQNVSGDIDVQPRNDTTSDAERFLHYRDHESYPGGTWNGVGRFQRSPRARGLSWPERNHFQFSYKVNADLGGGYKNVTVCAWGGGENLPSELIFEKTFDHWTDPRSGGKGAVYLFHYCTSMIGHYPPGARRPPDAYVVYYNFIAGTQKIPDPIYQTRAAFIDDAPVNTWVDIPKSTPLDPIYAAANRPSFDPTNFYTYAPTVFKGSWSGGAFDPRLNQILKVADTGHSVSSQNGAYIGELFGGIGATYGVWLVSRETSFTPSMSWPAGTSHSTDGFFADGARMGGHNAFSNQAGYCIDGSRLVFMPGTWGLNQAFQDDGSSNPNKIPGSSNTAPFFAATAYWPDRDGEKYDTYQGGAGGGTSGFEGGTTGWEWLPYTAWNDGQYMPCCFDWRVRWFWTWDGHGVIRWMDPMPTYSSDGPNVPPAEKPWHVFANLGDTYSGCNLALVHDPRRYWLILTGLPAFLSNVGNPDRGFLSVDTRTGQLLKHTCDGDGAYVMKKFYNETGTTGPELGAALNWFRDEIMFSFSRDGSDAHYSTMSLVPTSGSCAAGTCVHTVTKRGAIPSLEPGTTDDGQMGMLGFMPRMKGGYVRIESPYEPVKYLKPDW